MNVECGCIRHHSLMGYLPVRHTIVHRLRSWSRDLREALQANPDADYNIDANGIRILIELFETSAEMIEQDTNG